LRARITFSEFLAWLEYIRREEERTTKIDTYLAQIAMEIVRSRVKNPEKIKLDTFVLKFRHVAEAPAAKSRGPRDAKKSKAIWLQHLNIKPKRKKK